MASTKGKRATGGVVALALAGLAAGLLRRWRRRSNSMTWEQLVAQLEAADVPPTLAGVAAMRGTSQTAALRWLRSQGGDLRETAKVLADPRLMTQLAEAEPDHAAPISLAEVRQTLGYRSGS